MEKCSIKAINDNDANSIYFWLNKKHIETGMRQSHLPVVTNKYDLKYIKYRFDLVHEPKHQPFRRLIRNDLAVKLAKTLRTNKIDVFWRSLGFNVIDVFSTRQQKLTKTIKEVFEGEYIPTGYSVLDHSIDLYFHQYRLPVEDDDFGLSGRVLAMK